MLPRTPNRPTPADVPAVETVRLADGDVAQGVIPGVPAIPLTAAQIARLKRRRQAARRHDPLPSGSLFDEEGQRQQQLL